MTGGGGEKAGAGFESVFFKFVSQAEYLTVKSVDLPASIPLTLSLRRVSSVYFRVQDIQCSSHAYPDPRNLFDQMSLQGELSDLLSRISDLTPPPRATTHYILSSSLLLQRLSFIFRIDGVNLKAKFSFWKS